jgi:SAM-dependent methyltransferase
MEQQAGPQQPFVRIESCPICGSRALSLLRSRADGIGVLQCDACRMAFVESHPADLSLLYSDEYYLKPEAASDSGYVDYDAVAVHSLSWVGHLIRLIRPGGGRVLDVGCANGFLLERLPPAFQRFGIEVNDAMARQCSARGIDIIGRDICDPMLTAAHRGSFDVIVAIATLEHLVDMRGALERIRELLSPGGVFVFEVPLLSQFHDNAVWFNTSLEHIHYPTSEGLRRLLDDVFGLPPIGGELHIEQYASVYVGLVGGNPAAHAQLSALYARLFAGPPGELRTTEEKAFRFFHDVIHAGRTTPELLALLPEIDPAMLGRHLLSRIAALWQKDLAACAAAKAKSESQEKWARELEAARDYHAEQSRRWQGETEAHVKMLHREQSQLQEERRYWREMPFRGRLRWFLGRS